MIIGLQIFIAVSLTCLVALIVHSVIKAKSVQKEQLPQLDEPLDFSLEEKNVLVLKKYCYTKTYGYRTPEMKKHFFIIFQTDDGQKFEYEVEEDIYLTINEGQTGTIGIVNGNFYGFSY